MTKIINEDVVNSETLIIALEAAFINVNKEKSTKNLIHIELDNKKILISLRHSLKLMTVIAFFENKLEKKDDNVEILKKINQTNDEKVFIRAAITEDNVVSFDFSFRYSFGLYTPQFIDDLRFFSKLTDTYIIDLFPHE